MHDYNMGQVWLLLLKGDPKKPYRLPDGYFRGQIVEINERGEPTFVLVDEPRWSYLRLVPGSYQVEQKLLG